MLKYTFENDYVLGYVHHTHTSTKCVVGESLFLNMAAEGGVCRRCLRKA